MGPFDAVGLAVVCVAFVKMVQAVSQAFASRRQRHDSSMDAATLAEMDALKTRLAEAEERLDFAERLLARSDAQDQLPGRVER
jgi:hypothetical protein